MIANDKKLGPTDFTVFTTESEVGKSISPAYENAMKGIVRDALNIVQVKHERTFLLHLNTLMYMKSSYIGRY